MVSYSDIVLSLVEITGDDQGLSNISTIVENFESSNSLLKNLETNVVENCRKFKERGDNTVRSLNEKLVTYRKNIETLDTENKKFSTELIKDEESVKSEVEKIKVAKRSVKEANKDALEKEKQILEAVNVMKRLRNIAIDELQGVEQKTTQMNKFNVTRTASFLQMPSFQDDLKSLLFKSDSVNRGLLSTLILLTQSAGKQTYANPETVKKIVDMIEKIISNSHSKLQESLRDRDDKVKAYNEIINNSRTLIDRLKGEIERKVNNKAGNDKESTFYKNDIIFFEKALARRAKRNAFNVRLCDEQTNLVKRHFDKYQESLRKVTELRGQLATQ